MTVGAAIAAAAVLLQARASPPAPVRIGDDVCAVSLTYDIAVSDTSGHPVPGVEIWVIDRYYKDGKAFRIGITDATGRLEEPGCYVGSSLFALWDPQRDPVHFDFMALREGFGVERPRLTPPTDQVLRDGNLLGVPPGRVSLPSEWKVEKGPPWRSFRVKTSITLRPVR